MIKYKNLSSTIKTFYGVQFKPGESHFVPGPINHKKFIRISVSQEPPKITKTDGQKKTWKSPSKSEQGSKTVETKKESDNKNSNDSSKTNKSSPETIVKKEENNGKNSNQ